MDPLLEDSKFRCRKCRIHLFSVKELVSHKDQKLKEDLGVGEVQIDLSSHDKCSSWFLGDDEMLPWVNQSVEEAQWTEGKLYCPKCKSRIGAFDFIHGIQCNCGKFVIPAVWIQKSRVDHILPKSQIINLDIRSPVVSSNQSTRNCYDKSSELHHVTDSYVGKCSEFDSTNPRRDEEDITQIACSSVFSVVNTNGRLGEIEGKETCNYNDQETSSCKSSNMTRENTPCSHKVLAHKCIVLERNMATSRSEICTSASLEIGSSTVNQRQTCCSVRLYENSGPEAETSSVTDQDAQRRLLQQRCTCSCPHCSSCKAAVLESSTPTRKTINILDNGETYMQRSKRKRKGRHQISLENGDSADFYTEGSSEQPSICQSADQITYYSCLSVDEGSTEPSCKTMENKVTAVEIQDRHCCAVCLDLLYEPFKCSCDHVFCDPCLRQLNFRTSTSGTIRCPLCRQIVEHITPATEIRSEIRRAYDSRILRKREKAERRAAYRKWPLPSNHGPLRRGVSRTQRSVTLPCIICTFLICASMYTLVMIALLSNLTATDVISMY